MTLEVGQELWYVPRELRGVQPHSVRVTKVGRKWATIGEGWRAVRIDKETLWVDGQGYTPPARCYLSREDYERQMATLKAWASLRRAIDHVYEPPDGLTAEDILNVVRQLGLTSRYEQETVA